MRDERVNRSWVAGRGALLGLAVGDALGTTLEFSRPQVAEFPARVEGPHTEITGGGPFHVAVGQVTDDTNMAVCLARSMLERGDFDVDDVAHRYLGWRKVAFDIGGQTSGSLGRIADTGDPIQAGLEFWASRNYDAAGNGSLMRTLPIGVFFAEQSRERIFFSILDSMVTHADPRCVLACAAYNGAISHAVYMRAEGFEPQREDMRRNAMEDLHRAADILFGMEPNLRKYIYRAEVALQADLLYATWENPLLYGGDAAAALHILNTQGFVRVAFRLAFWQLMHATSFEAGLVDTVNRGGDADTNGAIVGGLLGAYFGEQAIPERWSQKVLHALEDKPQHTFWNDYHPRFFFSGT